MKMGRLTKHLNEVIDRTWNASGKCTSHENDIMNAVLGIGGEAGEIVDIHKKIFFHKDKEGYRKELLLEIGDLFYYLIKLMDLYGFTLKEVLLANKEKLFKRYEVKDE